MRKVKLSEMPRPRHQAALETEYLRELQCVPEALAMLQYDDGSPRQPGYLAIWTQGSAWVARFIDKDSDAQLTTEGRTLDEALDALALLLRAEDAPWEPTSKKRRK